MDLLNKDPIPPDALRTALEFVAESNDEITGKGQSWLARQLDVNPRTVRRWLSGDLNVTGATAVAVRSVLETHLES